MIMMYLQKLYIRRYQSQQNLRHIFPGIARWPLHCLLIILVWYYFMSSTLLFADDPLITQEIRYHTTETSEVFLVWGIDGWNVAPEEMRPTGTIVKEGHIGGCDKVPKLLTFVFFRFSKNLITEEFYICMSYLCSSCLCDAPNSLVAKKRRQTCPSRPTPHRSVLSKD